MKNENKTKVTNASVEEFIDRQPPEKHKDALVLLEMMERVSGKQAKMWGPSIIGFDSYHYRYESGREGDMCVIGFSPRKSDLTVYLVDGLANHEDQLKSLGKHRTSKACLYIKKLSDIDLKVLESIVTKSYNQTKNTNHIAGQN